MVGAAGFEPATFCSQSRRATRLRYTPRVAKPDTRFAIGQQASPKVAKRLPFFHVRGHRATASRRRDAWTLPASIDATWDGLTAAAFAEK